MSHPVLYVPGNELVGSASTERGAIQCVARRVSKLSFERWTARLAERLGDHDESVGLAWFVGPQLVQKRAGGSR